MDAFHTVDDTVSKKRHTTDQENDWRSWKKSSRDVHSVASKIAQTDPNLRSLPSFPRMRKFHDQGSHIAVGASKDPYEGNFSDDTSVIDVISKPDEQNDTRSSGAGQNLWSKLKEPNSESFYWFNQKTGETRYSDPINICSDIRQPGLSTESKVAVHHKTWTEHPMEQVQKALANQLKRTPYDGPTSMKKKLISATQAQKSAQPESKTTKLSEENPWIQIEDPMTRKQYYANKKTGKTQWENPCPLMENGKLKTNTLEWQRGIENGKVFWYCLQTGETRFGRKPS